MNKDLFKSLKILSISQNTSQVPTELVVDGRSKTEDEEIIKELGNSFFPAPKPIGPEQEEIINTMNWNEEIMQTTRKQAQMKYNQPLLEKK